MNRGPCVEGDSGRILMLYRSAMRALALAAALVMSVAGAKAFDDASYPDWSGSWLGIGGGSFDTSKPQGPPIAGAAEA